MKFSSSDSKEWMRLGPRAMFGQFMANLAKKNKKIMVLSADLGRSSGLARFISEFPNQYLSVGISEQNLIGVASGLASEGYKVFATSFAPFLSMRASEQIRMNLGYMKHNVNLVALGSGLSMGFLGNSHFGLEDIAVMRTIPNLNITCPADCAELGKILQDYTNNNRGPSYIRLSGLPGSVSLYQKDYNYKFGKSITITKGKDLLILSYGSLLAEIKISIQDLKKEHSIELLNIATIKPFDENIIKKMRKFTKIMTIEEHTSIGGLGSIVAEKIVKNKIDTNFHSISLPDNFGPTGDYNFLLEYYGLNRKNIKKKIQKFLKK
jgi:transketolase